MPDVTANFFTRQELQHIVLKANQLRALATCPDQKAALARLLAGAAELEGVLADLPPTNHPNGKALENPNGWQAKWVENSYTSGGFKLTLAQQVLNIPNYPKSYLGTGRFRLTLDGETYVSADQRRLHALLVRFLEPRTDVPAAHKEFLIANLFGGKDAIQEQGSAALDVCG